ncbi:serine/arginine-rich splicing factor 7-like [Argonauta hians]|uniref:Serine/arginine-rich splicing factor 7 n=2 Tax=Octopus TaxID=6643 RepID=A0A6P7TQU5_9MOLL|nr:serine/arginine-rich splicing factor 7 [Octopus bimaculoides]XP_029652255.1 serine/arginine-rich splicing factor 7 [Octopus sinensis]|eukprot:XP_014782997.1 PREDICTED: serine/arginine-rich splicing factor 7-like [Octopus bimaculoides]
MDCKIYVGDLPRDASEKEIERAFCYYGPLRNVWVARNPSGFAFVEFEDPRDAEDAVRALDGTNVCGARVRVEHSTGKVRPKPWMRGGRGSSKTRRPFHPEDRCFECGDRGHYAYDCSRYKRTGRSRYSKRHSKSRSRSRSGRSYSRSWSRSRSHSRSPRRASRSHSRN